MATKIFTGGGKLKTKLQELLSSLNKSEKLQVGFFEGSIENKTGVSTPLVAFMNEFGGTIPERIVPASRTKIYRRVDKNGNFLNGAKFVKRGSSNFETEHDVPEHVIPEHKIPSRPFFRRMIKAGEPHWGHDLGAALQHYDFDAEKALVAMGEQLIVELQKSIKAPILPKLAKSTVARKGNDQTLIDSNDMWNAVKFNVE
jgi:hypothetical protein